MAAKPRLNVRFDADVLAKLEAEVKRREARGIPADGQKASVTTLMQELCRAGLGMAPVEPEPVPAPVARPRPTPRPRPRPRPSGKRRPRVDSDRSAVDRARRVAEARTRAAAAARRAEVRLSHRPTCRCPVCQASKRTTKAGSRR